jgi:BirA family transcriptional regulator, biotin operon repressor / biotin---[acetyl-CoA-carboxylase] ligase
MYSRDELQSGLTTHIFGRKIFTYQSIDSTNACAKILAAAGAEEGTIVFAEYQTAGRGRLGRSWLAEPEKNLLFSLIIRPTIEISKIGLLPLFAAAGAALALESITGTRCECKWPNDVLFNNKKCCGILLESSFQNNALDYAIVGIGVNINQKVFDGDLNDHATSLVSEFGKEFDRKEVFQKIVTTLESLYKNVQAAHFETVINEWKSRATIFGKQVTLRQTGETIQGTAIALSSDGGLILNTSEGQKVYYAGDVTFAE